MLTKAAGVNVRAANSLRELIGGEGSAQLGARGSAQLNGVSQSRPRDSTAHGSDSFRASVATPSNSPGLAALGGDVTSLRPQIVISAVTASSSAEVARAAASLLVRGQIFLDINSCAPATKRENSAAVEGSGADYVEAAVMAPVPPQRLAVPMLLGGPRAREVSQSLRDLGFNATSIAEEIGVASAVKMCRSIVIKGIEALTTECVLAARKLGAEEQVFASLNNTFPHMGWTTSLPDYLVSRVAEHGRRRAAEMREVALTLEAIGMQPTMASAIAEKQDWLVDEMAAKDIPYPHGEAFSWRSLADALARKSPP
jgi:3-hydroxyisobutyrate dehydrogenase-like beta-hydroxyacid dehydrogenase